MAFELASQLKPTCGEALEVVVAWKDRVLSVFGFSESGGIMIGGGRGADVVIPTLPQDATYKLLSFGAQTRLLLVQGMSGEIVSNNTRLPIQPGLFQLQQGELACIELQDISLYIRHVPRSLKPKAGSLFDLASGESTGVVLALATTAILAAYSNLFGARVFPDEPKIEESIRRAKVKFKKVAHEPVAPAPTQAVPARRTKSKPGAGPAGIFGVFANQGLLNRIQKSLSADNDLAAFVRSSQHAQVPSDNDAGALRETGRGRDAQTVSVADGNGGRYGRSKYLGGLGKKASASIALDGHEADVSGGMDREAIRRVIHEHLAEIRTCYERELQRLPELFGKVVLEWDIGDGGRVDRTLVKSNSMESVTVPNCILTRLKTWRFPNPPLNQVGRVSYPFIFSAH